MIKTKQIPVVSVLVCLCFSHDKAVSERGSLAGHRLPDYRHPSRHVRRTHNRHGVSARVQPRRGHHRHHAAGKLTRSRYCVYKSSSQVNSHGQGIGLFTSHCHHATGKVRRSRDCFVYKSLSQVKSHGQGIVVFTSHCHHATGKVRRSRDRSVYKSLSPRRR